MIHILNNKYEVIDPWFGRARWPLELDLGCGRGKFTLELARRYPERLVLGSDIMLGRLRKVQAKAEKRGLANIELLRVNSLELIGYQLPDQCIRRLHLLCPDPWPKTRHRWRRLVTSDFLTRVARVLEPAGVLHLSTDHQPYLDVLKDTVAALPGFEPAPELIADVADIKTDFELAWLAEGKQVPHLVYRLRQ